MKHSQWLNQKIAQSHGRQESVKGEYFLAYYHTPWTIKMKMPGNQQWKTIARYADRPKAINDLKRLRRWMPDIFLKISYEPLVPAQ